VKRVHLHNATDVKLVFKLKQNKLYISCWYHYYVLMKYKLSRW